MVKKHFKPQPKIRKKASEKITAGVASEFISGISASYKMLERLASGDPFARISLKTKNPRLKKLESLLNQTAKSFQEMIDQSHELTMGISEHYDVLSRIASGNRMVRAKEDSENELIAKLGLLINKETSALTQQITEAENSSMELALGLSENF
jgi:two-component system cell cycle sensor histidine kinase/response regulator CckA